MDEPFCAAIAGHDNLAQHFHLSLQSGCDSVLTRMGRRYTTEEYYRSVQLLRQVYPECSVTTDLIVGFPGETETEFQQTLVFLEKCAFASVHVFPYSVRKGTRAAAMPDQLPHSVKEARAQQAKAVAARLSEAYRSRFAGCVMQALPEHRTGGYWAAHGPYGFPIYIDGEGLQKNHPVQVRVFGLWRDGVRAEVLPEKV